MLQNLLICTKIILIKTFLLTYEKQFDMDRVLKLKNCLKVYQNIEKDKE